MADVNQEQRLWNASKAGNVQELREQIAHCIGMNVDINASNPARFGCTALHYGL